MSHDTFTADVPKKIEGLVTSAKNLGDGLYEKKWSSGLRMYFAVIEDEEGKKTLLILGSGKGDQDKMITRSKNLISSLNVFKGNIAHK